MKLVAWDTETHLIQPGLLSPPIVCHSFAGDVPVLLGPDAGREKLLRYLKDGCRVAGANIAYDFGCLLAGHPEDFETVWQAYEEGRVFDVQIAATLVAIAQGRLRDGELFDLKGGKMLEPSRGTITNRYSLAVCVKEWLGRSDAKQNDRFRLSYALLEGTPIHLWPPDAQQYPIDDAVNTLDVAQAQIDSGFDFCDLPPQCHVAFCAHLAAISGIRTDPARVDALGKELLRQRDALRAVAFSRKFLKVKAQTRKAAAAGEPTELQKDTKVLAAAVAKAYLGVPPLTAKGAVSLSRETLTDSGSAELEEFAEVGKVEKLLTYLPTLEQAARGPLNVKPNILLSTGRASYEGMLQLMPRKGGVRDCFKARGTYVSVDYAAVELSTLAQVCLWTVGESRLADAINEGKDPHSIMACNLNGMDYDSFIKELKTDPALKDLRQAGKAANFGFPGMMGAPKFVIAKRKEGASVCEWLYRDGLCGADKTLEWKGRTWDGGPLCVRCIEEAAKLKKTYLATWSEIPKFWHWVGQQLEFTDVITQFVSNRIRGGVNEPQASNTYFQGLAADGAKRAVVALTKEMYTMPESPLYGSRLVVFAHDETIIDVPASMDLHEAAYRQRDVMVQEMRKVCPDVRISAEPAACKFWYKQMEPVFSDGRLVPWEPKNDA